MYDVAPVENGVAFQNDDSKGHGMLCHGGGHGNEAANSGNRDGLDSCYKEAIADVGRLWHDLRSVADRHGQSRPDEHVDLVENTLRRLLDDYSDYMEGGGDNRHEPPTANGGARGKPGG